MTRDRIIFAALRAIKGRSHAEISRKTGLCAQTISRLRRPVHDGGTRYPRWATVTALLRSGGLRLEVQPIDDDERSARTESRLNA